MLRFFIFRNIWIALCALCMGWETLLEISFRFPASGFQFQSAILAFIFFATFFVYNFHAFANHLVHEPSKHFFHLLDNQVSISQRLSVVAGLIGTAVTFLFVSHYAQLLCLLFGIVTLGYTLPVFKV